MNLVGKSFGTALRNLVAARRPVSSPAPAAIAAPPAPPPAPVWQGFVDARSRHHAAGWVRHLDSVARRPTVEVVLRGAGGERVLCRGQADEFSEALQTLEIGDGRHAFFLLFDAPLRPGEDDDVVVRVQGEGYELPNAPAQQRDFTPISYVALDVVNNCNLRCPFCCVDYQGVNKTKFMTEETFRNALALIPFVTEGNFWLSCLHEPTLNPRLTEFIDMVPRDYRRKIFYTTNMAKRMPASYFEFLACSGIHHINISMESFDKDIYEKMRKGARFDIFLENLEAMTKAFGQGGNPPRVRFSTLAYKSNLHELPELVRRTREHYGAWQNEIRTTYDMAYIDRDFAAEEYLAPEDWSVIRSQFEGVAPENLILVPPGEPEAGQPLRYASRPLAISMRWDGGFVVSGRRLEGRDEIGNVMTNFVEANINAIRQPLKFLLAV